MAEPPKVIFKSKSKKDQNMTFSVANFPRKNYISPNTDKNCDSSPFREPHHLCLFYKDPNEEHLIGKRTFAKMLQDRPISQPSPEFTCPPAPRPRFRKVELSRAIFVDLFTSDAQTTAPSSQSGSTQIFSENLSYGQNESL